VKRKALAIFLVATIALSIAAWVIYNQISELQNLIKNVKIAEFEWESGFNPIVGLTLGNRVNVTVQNSGSDDISGLTLAVKLVYNGTELETSKGFTEQIDTLRAGESLEISGWIYYYLSNWGLNGAECISTLMWGKVVLDEQTKLIVWD
jgi:hypothetical protein